MDNDLLVKRSEDKLPSILRVLERKGQDAAFESTIHARNEKAGELHAAIKDLPLLVRKCVAQLVLGVLWWQLSPSTGRYTKGPERNSLCIRFAEGICLTKEMDSTLTVNLAKPIEEDAQEWGLRVGLIKPNVPCCHTSTSTTSAPFSMDQWRLLNLGEAIVRIYPYAVEHRLTAGRFLGWIFVLDDTLEALEQMAPEDANALIDEFLEKLFPAASGC